MMIENKTLYALGYGYFVNNKMLPQWQRWLSFLLTKISTNISVITVERTDCKCTALIKQAASIRDNSNISSKFVYLWLQKLNMATIKMQT